MTMLGGKDILLQVDKSTDDFETIAGLKSKSVSFNGEAIDVSNHGSNQWREILENAGLKSVSISGGGVFINDDSMTKVRQYWEAGTLARYRLFFDFPSGSDYAYTGRFKVTTLEYNGEHNGEAGWSLTLESSGEIEYAVAT